jgi:hypothetical protein
MSKPRKGRNGRADKEARHVRLYHLMMKSDAWRALDCVSRCAYIEIASRYGGSGSNNGRIPYSLREMAEALNVSKATAMRAMKRLQVHGFIVEMKRGAFSLKMRHATEWRLTEFGCDVTCDMPSRDYRHWKKQDMGVEMKPNGFSGETARVSR